MGECKGGDGGGYMTLGQQPSSATATAVGRGDCGEDCRGGRTANDIVMWNTFK